ncbi:MAG: class I SAM-dependent methyltransferase [Oscillospiraceae bacterium]|nr:class I SAM-dependent methyltransferase [Oscillospiraceae bacterium]
MEKKEIIDFFARLAPGWDDRNSKNSDTISIILDNAGISAGKDVLDVACGTGILIPDYLQRGAASVTAIDITPEMAEIAAKKFTQENVKILCGDAAETDFGKKFDSIVVYNAFPHFPDQEFMIYRLACALKQGGILTVAHGMSRDAVNSHHAGVSHVSRSLMSGEELAGIFSRYLTVTAVIDNEMMYQVAGRLEKDLSGVQPPEKETVDNTKEGNRIMNEHEHEHEHMHEHTHEHFHEHHHHDHDHDHGDITAFESTEQAVMILGYMLDHNRSHAEELHEICHRLEATGEEEAAEYLDRAVDSFREGNDLMDKALRILKKEEE